MESLTYLAHWSRPDILFAVSNLVSNCSYPNQKDWEGNSCDEIFELYFFERNCLWE
jgi:hypothetical protein